jgi:hypothetical protein
MEICSRIGKGNWFFHLGLRSLYGSLERGWGRSKCMFNELVMDMTNVG